ncbi:MAG: transcription antitermination factor NusB [Firmicutes bacterium]|nr:transcription antitermination factor NusB [Bacillota bacterium]
MGRKIEREATMKLLFEMEINDDYTKGRIESFLENNEISEDESEYIVDISQKVIENLSLIDSKIEEYASGWKIKRIAKVDLSILRLAICEIFYREDIPIQVSINEAIEVSKKYSSDESRKFINGLLGSLVRELNKND